MRCSLNAPSNKSICLWTIQRMTCVHHVNLKGVVLILEEFSKEQHVGWQCSNGSIMCNRYDLRIWRWGLEVELVSGGTEIKMENPKDFKVSQYFPDGFKRFFCVSWQNLKFWGYNFAQMMRLAFEHKKVEEQTFYWVKSNDGTVGGQKYS